RRWHSGREKFDSRMCCGIKKKSMASKCLINWKLRWMNLNRSFWTRIWTKLNLNRRNCTHTLE
ncbi:hypothetical protein MKX03_001497, partial [Papaver bracteatum]